MGIEHLDNGVEATSLSDLKQFIASMPVENPPQEYQDAAQEILTRASNGSTQFTGLELIALAGLLLQLFTYFRDHKIARFLVRRAAAHPNGVAAMLVHHKMNEELPEKLRGVPNVAAGVTELTDAALTKAGI